MVDFLGTLQNIGALGAQVSDALGGAQLNALQFDDPSEYQRIMSQRALGDIRRKELEMRRQERQDIMAERARKRRQQEQQQEIFQNVFTTGSYTGAPLNNQALGNIIAQGATPETLGQIMRVQDAMRAPAPTYKEVDGTLLQIGPDGVTPVYSAPQDPRDRQIIEQDGVQYFVDSGSPVIDAPIRPSAAELEERQAERSLVSLNDELQNINTVIDTAIEQTSPATAGIGSLTAIVPGTKSADLSGTLSTIQADAAFSRLQQMRDQSKTGGALGQVSERELGLLSSARAAIEQSQSPEQLKANLERYKSLRKKAFDNVREAFVQDYGREPIAFNDASPYQTPDAVKAAFAAGEIDNATALGLLRDQFGFD